MKHLLVSVFLLTTVPILTDQQETQIIKEITSNTPAENIFIITTDGFRWQEFFTGADTLLLFNEKFTPGRSTMEMMYWAAKAEERRKKLMPFCWNVLVKQGQIFGNRIYDNKMNVANPYAISYPGYNEIFTGSAGYSVSSNRKTNNPNLNILEYLNSKPRYKGKIAAFTSWDVFPYILNEERSGLVVNAGYENIEDDHMTESDRLFNAVQQESVFEKSNTRHDRLTFVAAKEYIQKHRPKIVYIGFGETDEYAHNRRYDLYLQQANEFDRMLAELWHWVQTTPGYKDNTLFIITTDHGRGQKESNWDKHGLFTKGSSQTWLAVMGPGIEPVGEIKKDQQIYQKQLAKTIATLLGERFQPGLSE